MYNKQIHCIQINNKIKILIRGSNYLQSYPKIHWKTSFNVIPLIKTNIAH